MLYVLESECYDPTPWFSSPCRFHSYIFQFNFQFSILPTQPNSTPLRPYSSIPQLPNSPTPQLPYPLLLYSSTPLLLYPLLPLSRLITWVLASGPGDGDTTDADTGSDADKKRKRKC